MQTEVSTETISEEQSSEDRPKSKKKNTSTSFRPKPFVKWAGGKSQLIEKLRLRLPKNFGCYYEPFVGGGALFFDLLPRRAVLSDNNEELINLYRVIRNNVNELLESVEKHRYEKDYYYQLRDVDRQDHYQSWSDVEKASRFLYLNKTCFNGLYRVNAKGQFNVPFGKYSNPRIADAEQLLAASAVLQRVELVCGGFEQIEELLNKGDFVYFDPPYMPRSDTASFTSYTKEGFGVEGQESLAKFCRKISEKGVKWMLSNSPTELIYDLYEGFNFSVVSATRAINSKASKRGEVEELIITNY